MRRQLAVWILAGCVLVLGVIGALSRDWLRARAFDLTGEEDKGPQALGALQLALNLTTPPLDYEINLELTYAAQIIPGWTLQPVYTSIWHPSGTGIRYPDAQVAGVRSVIRF
jgi:porin